MSRCLRYQQPIIVQHLANQYVAGVMSFRVRARTDQLMLTTPELERAIAQLSESFAELHLRLPEADLKTEKLASIWESIDSTIEQAATTKHTPPTAAPENFWSTLFAWKIASGVGAFASMVLAVMLWFSAPQIIDNSGQIAGPSYLANMTAAKGDNKEAIQFVITAYSKTPTAPSRLHVQWSLDHLPSSQPEARQPLHLWAEDKDSGKITYIGVQPERDQPWDLTKPLWKAVANSRRLLMTEDSLAPTQSTIVFSGFCLQLKSWKA